MVLFSLNFFFNFRFYNDKYFTNHFMQSVLGVLGDYVYFVERL